MTDPHRYSSWQVKVQLIEWKHTGEGKKHKMVPHLALEWGWPVVSRLLAEHFYKDAVRHIEEHRERI